MINVIVCVNESFQIGNSKTNDLIYHIKDDMKHFRWLTEGSYVVMGKNTFESLPKPLENRINVVLSLDTTYTVDEKLMEEYDIIVAHDLERVLNQYRETGYQEREMFIIGGACIYAEAIHWADRVFLTMVHEENHPDGDVYFNDEELCKFKPFFQCDCKDEETGLCYSFINYKRKEE